MQVAEQKSGRGGFVTKAMRAESDQRSLRCGLCGAEQKVLSVRRCSGRVMLTMGVVGVVVGVVGVVGVVVVVVVVV